MAERIPVTPRRYGNSGVIMDIEDLIPYIDQPHLYGHYLSAVCPYHESEPVRASLLIYPDRYKCKSCNASGTTENLLRFLQGLPPKALPIGEDEFSYPPHVGNIPKYANDCAKRIQDTPHLGAYWIRRGLSRDTVLERKLGFSQGWYTIPVHDTDYGIIRVVHRAGPKIERPIAKYYSTKGKSVPYCPNMQFSLGAYTLFVVYGMIDALALCELGFASMTSSMGKENFNPEWLRMAQASEIIFIPDRGEEETARLHAREFGPRASVLKLDYDFVQECKDPADYLAKGRGDSLREQINLWLNRG